jgi:hypothetical protein
LFYPVSYIHRAAKLKKLFMLPKFPLIIFSKCKFSG